MIFEYDPEKSLSNKSKHGIDFEESKKLWDDLDLLEIQAKTQGEKRFLLVGMIDQ